MNVFCIQMIYAVCQQWTTWHFSLTLTWEAELGNWIQLEYKVLTLSSIIRRGALRFMEPSPGSVPPVSSFTRIGRSALRGGVGGNSGGKWNSIGFQKSFQTEHSFGFLVAPCVGKHSRRETWPRVHSLGKLFTHITSEPACMVRNTILLLCTTHFRWQSLSLKRLNKIKVIFWHLFY